MAALEQLQAFVQRMPELFHEPAVQAAAGFALLWALGAWRAFKAEYSASQWALNAERHKALKALAYAGALPFRLLFSIFTGFVEALVWSIFAGFGWLLWKVWHG
jgi:hypothetical protein